MARITYLDCCGWAELYGVQGYNKDQFNDLLVAAKGSSRGALLFSSSTTSKNPRRSSAQKFAKDIEAAGLGTVTALPVFQNPNTGNNIVPFLWVINQNALRDYCHKNNVRSEPYKWY
jgi:hypothetical protein